MTLAAVGLVALLLAGLLLGGLAAARSRWDEESRALRARLSAAAPQAPHGIVSARDFRGLPTPVARFLRLVVADGVPFPARVRVKWAGQFNLGKPGALKWVPFTADQLFVPAAPGFVWDARMRMAPGVDVFVRDGFVDGAGSMLAQVAGLVTVARASGTPMLAQAALLRYLGEATWFPAALLPRTGVRWEPVDARCARARLRSGDCEVALLFHFGADGLLASVFAPDRWFDDGRGRSQPRPWQARLLAWGEIDGRRVPTDAVVEWQLDSGPWPYWRGSPVAIETRPQA